MATRHRFTGRNAQSRGGWTYTQASSSTRTATANYHEFDSDDSTGEHCEPEIMTNAFRDRSSEFQFIIKSMRSRHVNGKVPQQQNKSTALQNQSEFSHLAKKISSDLGKTYEKLQKLTLLCKKRTLFDDKPVEIQRLTYIIKQDINSLKRQIQQLEERRSARVNNQTEQRHSTSVVKTLRSKLAGMSESFKSVLETRRENMKYQKSRKDEFSSHQSTSITASAPRGNSLLVMDEQRALTSLSPSYNGNNGSVAICIDDGGGMSSPQQQQQQQSLQLVEQQDNYITDRANTMENIETTIVELGDIFQQLATMVKEQEEQVLRIDSNVEESDLNITSAHNEILNYFQGISSNRWLMMKIFLVLIAFFIVFVVFFA